MSDKYILLNNRMRRIGDLNPLLAINPLTVEDLTTGEHTLQFGYPVDADEVIDHTWRIYAGKTWSEVI